MSRLGDFGLNLETLAALLDVAEISLADYARLVPEADRAVLGAAGFDGTKPVAPPATWDLQRRGFATEWMRLFAEVTARQYVRAYKPWTADQICPTANCPEWHAMGFS